MTNRTKSVLAVVVGQSNERGKAQLQTVAEQDGDPRKSQFGAPTQDPIDIRGRNPKPVNDYYGSLWPKVAETIATEKNYWLAFKNYGVGSTSWSQHWLGDTVGDGTGAPLGEGDAGFDPLGYMSAAEGLGLSGVYDERWVFMANGQEDSFLNTTHANYVQAIKNVADYYLARGFKVFIGFSLYQSQWTIDVGDLAWEEAVTSYAGNPNVFAGANLYRTLGVAVPMFDAHLANTEYDEASQDIVDAINASGA